MVVARARPKNALRREPLTRDRVLLVAVDVADRNGLEALSMRKLGQELGVDAMALYRHVRNKDDLLDGLVDVIVGQIERVEPDGNWKAALRAQALAARGVMLRHPWARRVLEERGTAGLSVIAYVETVLGILHAGGFSVDLAHHALHVLSSRIFGFSQDLFETGRQPEPSPETAATMMRVMAERYPHVSEMARSVTHEGVLGPCDDDFEFAFGLGLVLDGLERLRATA